MDRTEKMDGIEYVQGGSELLDDITPLWERLNALHARISPQFGDRFRRGSFHDRKEELTSKTTGGRLKVVLARSETENRAVGYCVGTVDAEGIGEIDSLFVDEPFRGRGIGDHLMRAALGWMAEMEATHIDIAVVWGNAPAHRFYERFGFAPSVVILRQPPPKI